jgi:hypothetical protein
VHAARQVLEVDLVHDAEAGRHDAEGVEGLHAPLHELVALLVALELELHVQVERVARAVVVDHHEWSTTRSTGTSGSMVFGSLPIVARRCASRPGRPAAARR